ITATARDFCCRVMGAFTRFPHIGRTALTRTRRSSSAEGAPFSVSQTWWISPASWLDYADARRGRWPMRCKANFAAHVNTNVPQQGQTIVAEGNYILCMSLLWRKYSLDKLLLCGVFIITDMIPEFLGGRLAHPPRPPALQARNPLGRGDVEFLTRKGPRPQVPGQRVLRSARSCAGQI